MQRYLGQVDFYPVDVEDIGDIMLGDIVAVESTVVDNVNAREWFSKLSEQSKTMLELLATGVNKGDIAKKMGYSNLDREIRKLIKDARESEVI
jgi:hypothetical protein